MNLFVVEPRHPDPHALENYRRSLEPEAERLGAALGEPRWDDDAWLAKLDVVLELRPEVVSFTFGCPSTDVLQRLAQRDIHTTVTVTTPEEAREAVRRGAASVCVQGPEAGGHRGVWDPEATPGYAPLPDLVPALHAGVEVPVIAAGGLDGPAAVDSVLRQGAVAAQVGTALLLADEAGTNAVHRAALTDPSFTATAVTRAFTGRWARGLANRFMAEHPDAPAAYPHLHHMTAPLRAAALAEGDVEVAHLWAGTGYAGARGGSAREIVRRLAP